MVIVHGDHVYQGLGKMVSLKSYPDLEIWEKSKGLMAQNRSPKNFKRRLLSQNRPNFVKFHGKLLKQLGQNHLK